MTDQRLRIHAAALHYFDAVRRAGSIREASRRLNVASSAVNRQILALEQEVHAPLFERLPAGLTLTAAGEALADHVIGVLRDAERLRSALDALKGLHAGHAAIVTLEGLCHHVVPAAIERMNARYPRVTIGVDIVDTQDIPRAVIGGDADLGLAFEVPADPDLRLIAAVRVRLGAVVRPDSPLAGRESLTLNDLRDQAVILPKENFANRGQLRTLMRNAGMVARGRYEAASIELMKQLALRGLGAALMTRVGIEAELAAGSLLHLPLRQGRGFAGSELGLYARAASALPMPAEMLAHHLGTVLAEAVG